MGLYFSGLALFWPQVWPLRLPAVPTSLTHSNIWLAQVQSQVPSRDKPQWDAWELETGFLESLYAARATSFSMRCSDVVSTAAPFDTPCFEAAVDHAHMHSPWGAAQFVPVPNTWLGGDFGDAISWQGIRIFDGVGPSLALSPPFVTAFAHVASTFLAVLAAKGVAARARPFRGRW